MTLFDPTVFFDLSSFAHKELFDGQKVWETLSKIAPYLTKQKTFSIQVEIPDGVFLVNRDKIAIGKGSIVEPGAYIKGPCIIGEHCTIRHGAYIRGDVIVGDHSVIGHDTEIKNSILLHHAHAAHFAYLGDTILGNRVNLGAGVKCANLRIDNKPIVIHHEGERFETHLRKFGAIVGDGVQIGCNAVTNPGTLIGKNVDWYPCTNYGGYIPENGVVRPELKIQVGFKKHLEH
jgi:NDP-sugar pyrophosphorylase family protein